MKLKSKYYTPSIEELYPDIDVRIKGLEEDPINVAPYHYRDEKCSINLRKEVNVSSFKIKYLDSSDIEELGFTQSSKCGAVTEYVLGNRYKLVKVNHEGITYSKYQIRIFENIFNMGGDNYTDRVFIGIIKNKHELKKLLAQLGIIG